MRLTRAGIVVAGALVGASACLGRRRGPEMHPLGPTLEIVNTSSLVYRIAVNPALVVHIHPGQRRCVWAGKTHEARTMEVFALAGSVSHFTPPENLMGSPGWILEIGELPKYDVLSLRPAEPCRE